MRLLPKAFSNDQKLCIADATIEPLSPFRTGYARSKAGPFHRYQTVQSLVRRGALRIICDERANHTLKVTARSA